MEKFDKYLLSNYQPKVHKVTYALLNVCEDEYQIVDAREFDTRSDEAGHQLNAFIKEHFKGVEVVLASFNPKLERSFLVAALERSFKNIKDRRFLAFRDLSIFTLAKSLFNKDSLKDLVSDGQDYMEVLAQTVFAAYQCRSLLRKAKSNEEPDH